MTPESVMMMGTEAMKIAIAVAAPLLLALTGLALARIFRSRVSM